MLPFTRAAEFVFPGEPPQLFPDVDSQRFLGGTTSFHAAFDFQPGSSGG